MRPFIGKNLFVADLAHQAIISKYGDDKNTELTPIVKDYEGVSLLGPHSLVFANTLSKTKQFKDLWF